MRDDTSPAKTGGLSTDTKWIIGTIVPAILVAAGLLSVQISAVNSSLNTRIDDLNARIGDVNTSVNARINDLRGEMNRRIDDLRSEMNRRIDDLQDDIRDVRVLVTEALKRSDPAD